MTVYVKIIRAYLLQPKVPSFYTKDYVGTGTSMGHIASQKVAIGSGFVPAWAELVTDRLE